MWAIRVLYFIFSAGDIIITIFFLYRYTRRAVKPFRYATNVTLLRCACMCATPPPPIPVARVTPPPPNQHTNLHALTHMHTHTHTQSPRDSFAFRALCTHTRYPPLAMNSASSVAAASLRELGLEERVFPPRLHVLLRTFPNKNHPTDTLLKLISSTHVIYYYVVWYILPLHCGIIITMTTRRTQTTGGFLSVNIYNVLRVFIIQPMEIISIFFFRRIHYRVASVFSMYCICPLKGGEAFQHPQKKEKTQ